MSHLSDLTLELAEKSNFCNRYLELCSRYSESLLMDTTAYVKDIQEVLQISQRKL